jgi:Ca2+-binding RTX toxin-like protein
VDHASDRVIEAAGEGVDILLASVSYVLAEDAHVERLSARDWAATTAINITGNSLANLVIGNAGKNLLDGGGGADTLQGREGDDTYIVDHALDQVIEAPGEGTDSVRAKVSYTLAAGASIEVLTAWDLLGTAPLALTGNEFANLIVGNAGANDLFGGGGADTLSGGAGNDRYYVDNAGVQVVEAAGQGSDLLLTSVNYVLPESVHIESLSARDWSATTAINITGNSLANIIVGNAGNNILYGGGGIDVMEGREGHDSYGVDNALDVVIETPGQGNDTVRTKVSYALSAGASIEMLTAWDLLGTTPLTLTGTPAPT